MKKGNRSLGSRICALVIGLWLLLAGLLTWAVARDFQRQLYDRTEFLVTTVWGSHFYAADDLSFPGDASLAQINRLRDPYRFLLTEQLLPIVLPQAPGSYSSDDWFWGDWTLVYGFQSAAVFYDEAGNTLVKSGNLLSMYYITEESWEAQNTDISGKAYIDLDQLPQGAEFPRLEPWDFAVGFSPTRSWPQVIRATGYFDGDAFIPVSADVSESLPQPGDGELAAICRQDQAGSLQWENALTLEAPADRELVTIYIRETAYTSFDHQPVRLNGKNYASLVELVQDKNQDIQRQSGNLLESVFFFDIGADPGTGAATVRLAVRCNPLGYAALRLLPFYGVGTLAVAICLWLLLRYIHKNLARPLKALARDVENGRMVTPASGWEEVRLAEEYLEQAQNQAHALQNDVQQLQAALDYARHAEENRRQLVSNITHELKTPLAVIHSYAEGLQSGIAAEKREDYLGTILEETEKMDAMVLEMLELSRLEAGKVRLSSDQFSLLALATDILNKLAPEESRIHEITIPLGSDCMVVADEGRIAQVVTNLLSNALKYTPAGGKIWLQVAARDGSARFTITNSAAHLPEDALEKIFEPFYRVDPARSDKGTGLGLPIARNIVKLHRGSLTARNAWTMGQPCLEFTFSIPLQ